MIAIWRYSPLSEKPVKVMKCCFFPTVALVQNITESLTPSMCRPLDAYQDWNIKYYKHDCALRNPLPSGYVKIAIENDH